ncbi:PKD domain-containing protein [Hufsiella ginkgonis]|uniref:PKD domain-containing protein n=1 Tax=Hufsiella ginkgonis TaxID=2695274 RepID=A0A7K1XYW6_9SPHI|nr:PKD domain-containing protein [Hufsiella ginkgonis]MXV15939.1 PKD domain-containing protein [Hufsiella ginkgonis]
MFSLFAGRCLAQNVSNEGTEFYAVFPTHVPGSASTGIGRPVPSLAKYNILITGRQKSSGVVSVGNFSTPFDFDPAKEAVISILIPRDQAYISSADKDQVIKKKVIRVSVNPGQPRVVVYGHIYGEARSAASLILPENALGQRYIAMSYNQYPTSDADLEPRLSMITIVAADDNTDVLIRVRQNNQPTGNIVRIRLPQKGDVYEYTNTQDLTGTIVEADPSTSSCKRIAVFTGSSATTIYAPNCSPRNISADPLYQQAYPVESWGNTYGFVPFSTQRPGGKSARTRGSIYRVVAKEDLTTVRSDNQVIATLNAGQFYELPSPATAASMITADKPIAVAQYALTQDCAGGAPSDPDMVLLNPVEYNISNITVFSSPLQNIQEKYLNVLIKTTAAASFRINGAMPAGNFTAMGTSGYSFLKLILNGNYFKLSASEGFNAIAYGFGDYESYAYSAGTNLASTQTLTAVRVTGGQETGPELSNACTLEDFRFRLVLNEPAISLRYNFADGSEVVFDPNPVPKVIVKNGKTLYQYFHPKTKTFETAGQRNVEVTAQYAGVGSCNLAFQDIEFIFDVYDPPTADFSAATAACAKTGISFTDKSTDKVKEISTWTWDFGDGEISSEQNPVHSYARPGTYIVKLSVASGTGCTSNVAEHTVTVRPLPVAVFANTDGTCENNTFTFTGSSQPAEGTIVKWSWDFGDGTTVERISGGSFNHTFAKVGNYPVALRVTNSLGCTSEPAVRVVNAFAPSLEAGPDMVILVDGEKKMNIFADGNNIRYKWTPSAGLSRDDIKNPVASPKETTIYSVTITTGENCTRTDQLEVRVIPDFKVPNTFTPNNDGINDHWTINYLDSYPDVLVTVFNRYGIRVFMSVGYTQPWDGTSNGNPVPVGTYYYVIQARDRKPHSGYVAVVR